MTDFPILPVKHFELTAKGLIVKGNPSYEQWERVGRCLSNTAQCLMWAIGDWLNYGEWKWGEKYTQAIEVTEKANQTLRNAKWVAGRIDLSRRRDNLSFEHHKEVAALEPKEQDRLLDEVEKNNWTRNQLREEARRGSQRACGWV